MIVAAYAFFGPSARESAQAAMHLASDGDDLLCAESCAAEAVATAGRAAEQAGVALRRGAADWSSACQRPACTACVACKEALAAAVAAANAGAREARLSSAADHATAAHDALPVMPADHDATKHHVRRGSTLVSADSTSDNTTTPTDPPPMVTLRLDVPADAPAQPEPAAAKASARPEWARFSGVKTQDRALPSFVPSDEEAAAQDAQQAQAQAEAEARAQDERDMRDQRAFPGAVASVLCADECVEGHDNQTDWWQVRCRRPACSLCEACMHP